MSIDPQQIEGREYQPVLLRGGLNLTQSKYDVYGGTLQDCLNYESDEQGYSRSQGLLFYDGTYDSAIEDLWLIQTTTGGGGESSLTGDELFTLGGEVTWGTDSTGTVVYWYQDMSTPKVTRLGIVNITGDNPADGDTLTDVITGSTIVLAATLAITPSILSESTIADTVAEYLALLNTSINAGIVNQAAVPGYSKFHGKIPGTGGITGGFQFQDVVYGVRDYYTIGFWNGIEELFVGDNAIVDITANSTVVTGVVAEVQLVTGDWSNGNAAGYIIIEPSPQTTAWLEATTDFAFGDVVTHDEIRYICKSVYSIPAWLTATGYFVNEVVMHNSVQYRCISNHTSGATTEPGVGASWATVWVVDSIFEPGVGSSWATYWDTYDASELENAVDGDAVYKDIAIVPAADFLTLQRDFAEYKRGHLWKATVEGWESVNTGHNIDFKNGENAPSVREAPLFVTNMLDVVKDAGYKDWVSPSSAGASPYIAWTTAGQGTVSNNTYATAVLAAGKTSRYLLAKIDSSSVPSSDVRILGIEVEVENWSGGGAVPAAIDTSVALLSINESWYWSSNRAQNEPNLDTEGFTNYGSDTDLWGVEEIDPQSILDGTLYVALQYHNPNGVATNTYIDNVRVKVHYVTNAEHVFINDGTTDVAEADITAWQITNGEYTWTDYAGDVEVDASGTVTLTGGAAGSVDSILVNGVQMLSAVVPFNTTLAQTATDVANNILFNTTSPNYVATALGAVITITAVPGAGSSPNGFDVTSSATTITTTDIDMYNGIDAVPAPRKPAGVMTIYNITDVAAVKPEMVMYTEASAGGDVVATIGSAAKYNSLPSEYAMRDSQYESILANFYADADATAKYGVTGASPAFTYNGNFFSFIKTPLLEVADKPRHIAFHINMLALAYKTGHVLLSTIGAPHDFSSAQGGTAWGFQDSVTGIQGLPGATLAVLTNSGANTLTGTDPSSMEQKNIQTGSGCIEYSLEQIIEPFYLDFHGISNLGATHTYGDFNFGRISNNITPWLKDRLQGNRSTETSQRTPVASVALRNKNQYRLYFDDGYILTTTLFPDRPPEFTWQHYDTTGFSSDYVPTFIDSTIMSTGRERAIMGTSDGSMWVIDGANGIQTGAGLTEMDCYIVTNPINLGRPESVSKFHHITIQGQFYGWQNISGWADSSYVFNATGPAQATTSIGASTDATVIDSFNLIDNMYLPMLADGYSIKLQTSADGSKPHTFQSLLFRTSVKGTDRTRTPKVY